MRIIGGRCRGRKLSMIKGRQVRPTADRVREAIFNIIREEVPLARVLDLFAGSGALGLEALSRGAARALFIDHQKSAVAMIQRNIAACRSGEAAQVLCQSLPQGLFDFSAVSFHPGRPDRSIFGRPANCLNDSEFLPGCKKYAGLAQTMIKAPFNLVFMDPPYEKNLVLPVLQRLAKSGLLSPRALIVVEHAAAEAFDPLPGLFILADQRRYGKTLVSMVRFRHTENSFDENPEG